MALVLLTTAANATQMGTSGGFDLDALWTTAQNTYDLNTRDAIVLLESRQVTLAANGDLATTIHRVVWINSATAIHDYADLRVPWNTANSQLKVEILRTWRDGQWWPDPTQVSKTAVVATLPYAVNHAADYTTMRETMLLHDGIELPCIMETSYTIMRQGVPAAEGVFVFPQRDPAVQVHLAVVTPAVSPWHAATLHSAPQPAVTTENNTRHVVWDMSPVAQLGLPLTTSPAAYEPVVVYSTWESWHALSTAFNSAFATASHLDGALADTLTARTQYLQDPLELVQTTLDLVQESTRRIPYDFRFWDQPRPANRTWSTAYGHDLDRLALAAGSLNRFAIMSQDIGQTHLTAQPVFLGHGNVALAPEVPRLVDAGELALQINLPNGQQTTDQQLLWTPDGALHGASYSLGRPLTAPATMEPVFIQGSATPNRLQADLQLALTDGEGWTWSGTLTAQGVFSFHEAVFTGQELSKATAQAMGEILPDLEIESCNPRTFAALTMQVAARGDLAQPDDDPNGELTLTIGDPGDGLLKHLPPDIRTYQSQRTSATFLNPMRQDLNVQIPLHGFVARYLPAGINLTNDAGRFTVWCVVKNNHLYYKRSLMLTGQGTWQELRALLIEAATDTHRDIVLHAGGES